MKIEITTPDKILNTAESLFAKHGIGAVSLRQIVAAAEVNIAAIHYHFGSKDELIKAVFSRRLKEINTLRICRLNQAREHHGDKPLPLREFLEAFLLPALELGTSSEDNRHYFFKIIARAHTESNDIVQEVLSTELKPIVQHFVQELSRIIPGASHEELMMRLALVAGAMVQSVLIRENPHFHKLLGGDHNTQVDLRSLLLSFCEHGIAGVLP